MKNSFKTAAALLFLTPAAFSLAQDVSTPYPAPITVANPVLTPVWTPVLTQVVPVPAASNTLSEPTKAVPVMTGTPSATPRKKVKKTPKVIVIPTPTPIDTE